MNKAISMKELRENFSEIRDELKTGVSFTLIYHSKPLAEIKPMSVMPKTKKTKARDSALSLFAYPPKIMLFKGRKNAVDLIRDERS